MKKMLLLILLILVLPLIKADTLPTQETSDTNLKIISNIPDAVDLNTTRFWNLQVYNETHFITTGVTCYFDVYNEYSNGSLIYRNSTLSYSGTAIPVNVPFWVFNDKGTYSFRSYCNTTAQAGLYSKNFYVTKDGETPANDALKIFLWLMFIVTGIGIFWSFFLTLFNLSQLKASILNILFSWGSYIGMIITLILSQNYLLINFIDLYAEFLIKVMLWTNGVFPVIAFIICLIVIIMTKQQVPNNLLWGGSNRK